VTPAVILARVSSEEQVLGYSLDGQVAECTERAHKQGYGLIGVYKDEGISGTIIGRPALRSALQALPDGGVLLVWRQDRVGCAIVVGMMTTWRDLLLYKCWTHTWMFWASLLPKHLDYPEVFGLRVPRPAMVLNNTEDPLFTLSEMERADGILREVYQKAGVPEKYACNFHPGTHKFDQTMQEEAFAWFDRWLKPG